MSDLFTSMQMNQPDKLCTRCKQCYECAVLSECLEIAEPSVLMYGSSRDQHDFQKILLLLKSKGFNYPEGGECDFRVLLENDIAKFSREVLALYQRSIREKQSESVV